MNRRTQGWEDKLHLFVEEKRGQPFAWGSNDCCVFAADWCAMALGIDPAEKFRGGYDTALGAARILDTVGGVEALATGALGVAPDEARFAGRGDIVSFTDERGTALGVCVGTVAAFVAAHGLMFKPITACGKSWRVL